MGGVYMQNILQIGVCILVDIFWGRMVEAWCLHKWIFSLAAEEKCLADQVHWSTLSRWTSRTGENIEIWLTLKSKYLHHLCNIFFESKNLQKLLLCPIFKKTLTKIKYFDNWYIKATIVKMVFALRGTRRATWNAFSALPPRIAHRFPQSRWMGHFLQWWCDDHDNDDHDNTDDDDDDCTLQEWQHMQLHDWELLLMCGCSCWCWWKDDEDVQKDRPTYAIVGMFGMNPIQWANISNFVTGAAASRNIQFCNRLHSLDTFGSLSILQWNWTVTLIDTHEHILHYITISRKSLPWWSHCLIKSPRMTVLVLGLGSSNR